MRNIILGIDSGTQSTKVLAVDANTRTVLERSSGHGDAGREGTDSEKVTFHQKILVGYETSIREHAKVVPDDRLTTASSIPPGSQDIPEKPARQDGQRYPSKA